MNQKAASSGDASASASGQSASKGEPDKLLTVAQYARHAGIHRSTVSRQVAAGVIPNNAAPGKRPMIDAAEADAARAAGLDHGKRRIRRQAGAKSASASPNDGDLALAPPTFSDARTQREQAQAGLAELNLETRAGRLVNRAAVEAAAFEAGKILRERILAVPVRLAGEIVTMVRDGAGDREIAGLIGDKLRDSLADVVTTIAPAAAELS